MNFEDSIKGVSPKAVEAAFAKALSELTGCAFSVSISSLSFSSREIQLKFYQLPGEDEIAAPF